MLLQKKIVRIICGVPPRSHSAKLFSELGILRLNELYLYNVAVFMYKLNMGKLPKIFPMFILNSSVHTHLTRQSNMYHIPLCRTVVSQMSVTYHGPVIWNDLVINVDINCAQ